MEQWKRLWDGCRALLSKALSSLALLLISAYRLLVSGAFGANCRFKPTCSHYAQTAFSTHPPLDALVLTVRRIGRCHPFGGFGFDPVPEYRGRFEKE